MIDNRVLVLVVIGVALLGCEVQPSSPSSHGNDQNEIHVFKTYHINSKVKAERRFRVSDGDTIAEGLSKVYYENGQLELEVEYRDGVKHGLERAFYENGRLRYVGFNLQGDKDSVWTWYYDSPSRTPIRVKEFWKRGRQVAHQYMYRESGQVEAYAFGDPMGYPVYTRHYDSTGRVVSEEGKRTPLIEVVKQGNIREYAIGDTMAARVYSIYPPDMRAEVYIRNDVDELDWKKLSWDSNTQLGDVFFPLNEVGEFRLEVKLVLIDLASGELTEHKSALDYEVL